jgi:predicted RNA-binding Zn ribbon-like protein
VARNEPPCDSDIEELNRTLATTLPRLQLCHGGACCSWRWVSEETTIERLLWPVVRSAADLLTGAEVKKVRECASDTCPWLFIDTSRNQRRKWCDMRTCGNRAKARRHYQRCKTRT